ncbi:hypothetical protein LQG66_00625 [Bradyrhizobium ontarionense]|uniref:SprT-like domain-containing protein n=1 Tax=Bradyrhizobium ontarionense TaxID=2898149 RepID=A0ABY3RCP3_9BRAD|nr:hypothetical protein [Bradyrhizobium sp. A19]UFZ04862.1 hypothetical protein LQG66_00625 [Bradyrhizobium sp. A19]
MVDASSVHILEPRPAYVHRYAGPLLTVVGSQADTQWRCDLLRVPHSAGAKVYGCQVFFGRDSDPPPCVIYITIHERSQLVRAITTHEVAHCNGWRHSVE